MTKYSSKKPQKTSKNVLWRKGVFAVKFVGGGNVLILSDIAWCAHVA